MNHCKRERETKRIKLPVPQYISPNMLHFYESVIPSGSLYSVWRVSQEMRKAQCRLSKKQGTLLSNFSEIHCVRLSAHRSRIERHFCLKFTMCISSRFWNSKSCLKIKTFKRSSVGIWYSDPAEWGSGKEKTVELNLGFLSWFTVTSA